MAKAWVYLPRNASPEIHLRKETILEDMEDDLAWAREEEEEESSWWIHDDSIFVDEGGHAYLVEIVE